MPRMSAAGPSIVFRAIGGPHDGDQIPMPIAMLPTSKSLVLQDNKGQIGLLSKYFFNKLTRTATYQGMVQVAPDSVNG